MQSSNLDQTVHTDTQVPTITDITFKSNNIFDDASARDGSLVTLLFTVSDDSPIPSSTAAILTVTISGQTRTLVGAPDVLDVAGKSKRYTYQWAAPGSPAVTQAGYTINVVDAANNAATASAANVIAVGACVSLCRACCFTSY